MNTFGPAYDARMDGERLRTQMEAIRELMLGAGDCGHWLTLAEIERLTHYPQASISAQLRHLRKPAFGSYIVEKRRRGCVAHFNWTTTPTSRGVWEYRLMPRTSPQSSVISCQQTRALFPVTED